MANPFVEIEIDWSGLRPIEYGQLYQQAMQLAHMFLDERERVLIGGVFQNLGTTALVLSLGDKLDPRRVRNVIPRDYTAPDDQQRDDIGVLMAWVMKLRDAAETLPGVHVAWQKVLDDLAAERDRS